MLTVLSQVPSLKPGVLNIRNISPFPHSFFPETRTDTGPRWEASSLLYLVQHCQQWATVQYPNYPNSVHQTPSNVHEDHQRPCLVRPTMLNSTRQSRTPSPWAPHHETIICDFTWTSSEASLHPPHYRVGVMRATCLQLLCKLRLFPLVENVTFKARSENS